MLVKRSNVLIKLFVLLGLGAFALAFAAACSSDDTTTPTPAPMPMPMEPEPMPPVTAPEPEWELVWSDEFDGSTIDTDRWNFEINCWGGGNNESQCYTDAAENAFIQDGVLNIVALREEHTGNNGQDGVSGETVTRPYTSARLTTKDKGDWTYGRFEIRARLPEGQGTWPALWLLSTDYPFGDWAASGEIDIVEAINLKADDDEGNPERSVHGTLHYGRAWPGNVMSGTSYDLPNGANPADDFHTYALEWEEGEIRWYVDGVHYQTQRESGWYTQYTTDADGNIVPSNDPDVATDDAGDPIWVDGFGDAPFGSPFHLIMNLAVGGNWPSDQNEEGIDESVFPQAFEIDYVRVYECANGSRGGKGCGDVQASATLVDGHLPPGVAPEGYAQPPEYNIFDDGINPVGIRYNSYNPDGVVTYEEVDDAERGKILTLDKTETAGGNVYFESTGGSIDARDWEEKGVLSFDYRINSVGDDTTLLIKLDSGWPNVSDVAIPTDNVGEWRTYEIGIADLVSRGNSLAAGMATLRSFPNVFVIEPTGQINASFDNIRYVESDSVVAPPMPTEPSGPPAGYGQPPEYVIFDREGINQTENGLIYNTFNPDEAITHEEVDDAERGKLLNIVKTGANGNVYFQSNVGALNLTAWSTQGQIRFDYRINSAGMDAEGNSTNLLIKIDSGWPNVSDVTLETDRAMIGEWQEYSIDVSDLADNPNSIDPSGMSNLGSITNVFVIEPNGEMDVSFANIRFTGGDASASMTENMSMLPDGYAEPPLYEVFNREGINQTGEVLRYDGFMLNNGITYEEVADSERGMVLTVDKTEAAGNIFFNSSKGAIDFSDWSLSGELKFDYRINSVGDDVNLLIKIDSVWPDVSDVTLETDRDKIGEWQEYSIDVADLADNGNSIDPSGNFDLSAVVNVFVIEPTGQMNVSFANIRYANKS